jgi:hypothetical protein
MKHRAQTAVRSPVFVTAAAFLLGMLALALAGIVSNL